MEVKTLGALHQRWLPPTEDREAIMVHPQARIDLRRFLASEPVMRGVGYSEFIERSVQLWRETLGLAVDESEGQEPW